MQFLASISLDLTRRSDVERALPAETARVCELMQSGQMHGLYIPEAPARPVHCGAFSMVMREETSKASSSRCHRSPSAPPTRCS